MQYFQILDIRGNNIKHIPLEVGKLRHLLTLSYDKDQISEDIWKGDTTIYDTIKFIPQFHEK